MRWKVANVRLCAYLLLEPQHITFVTQTSEPLRRAVILTCSREELGDLSLQNTTKGGLECSKFGSNWSSRDAVRASRGQALKGVWTRANDRPTMEPVRGFSKKIPYFFYFLPLEPGSSVQADSGRLLLTPSGANLGPSHKFS